jgi:hypothetical protein
MDAESRQGRRALQRLRNLRFLTSAATERVQIHRLMHAFVPNQGNSSWEMELVERVG